MDSLIGTALNLYVALGSMAILTILIFPIHEHSSLSIFLYHLHFLLSVSYGFQSTSLLTVWLDLFLHILFFLMQL